MALNPDRITDPGLSILVVDDSRQYTMILEKMLRSGFGYENISVVLSVDEGYSLISSGKDRFELLFIDYRFPNGATGGELLERLAAEGHLDDRVAFLITSEPTIENQSQAMKAGAFGVVAKPFDREELKRQIDRAQQRLRTEQMDHF